MYKYISLLFLVLCAAQLTAQNAGFAGKKTLVEVYSQLNYRGLAKSAGISPITFRVHGERIIGRRNSLSLNYEYIPFNMQSEIFHVVGDVFDAQVATDKYNFKVTNQAIGTELRFYRRLAWCVAPLGRYTSVGLNYISSKGTTTTDSINTVATRKRSGLVLTLGFGNRMIFWDRLTLDMGLQLGVDMGVRFERTEAPEDPLSDMERYSQIYFKENLANTLTKSYLIRANLGIGVLLF